MLLDHIATLLLQGISMSVLLMAPIIVLANGKRLLQWGRGVLEFCVPDQTDERR